ISCVPARYLKNAWCQAVGTYRAQGATRSWAVAWNGTAWTREPVQNPTGSSVVALQSVSCRMIQCLAVGYWQEGKLKSPLSEHLSVHGGNRKWVFDPMTPRPGRGSAMFGSVSWLGPNVARAAGTYFDVKHHVWHTLIEDWQDKWRLNGPADCYYKCRTAVPNAPVKGNSILVSVSCLGGTCMAVGHDIQPGETSITKPLV